MADTTRNEIVEQLGAVTRRHFADAMFQESPLRGRNFADGTSASAQPQPSVTMADVQAAVDDSINAIAQLPGGLEDFGFSGFAQVIEDPNLPLGQILWAGNLAVANPSMAFRLDNIAPFIQDLTPPPPAPEDPPTYLRKRVLRGK